MPRRSIQGSIDGGAASRAGGRFAVWWLAAAALLSCASVPARAPSAIQRGSARWLFEVTGNADATELAVDASFPPGTPAALGFEADARRFVTDLAIATSDGWRALAIADETLRAPECAEHGCRIRYRYRLAEAAEEIHDVDTAIGVGKRREAIEAPPSTWLIHPRDVSPEAYRVHVAPSLPFLSPLPRATDGAADTYEARGAGLEIAPFAAVGAGWHRRSAAVGGAVLTIGIAPGERALDDDAVVEWITHAAEGIAAYYGRFPSKAPLFLVLPDDGTSTDGKTLGNGGASTILRIGPRVTPALARASWVATHEMIHLNFPSFGYPHSWLEEGLATYVEPIVRARAGTIAADAVWHDLLAQGASGLPQAGDEGLERTHTWGRTYWGGALFFLLADVEIRARTKNARSLDDALRAVIATGATVAESWEVAHFLEVADGATGQNVLHELFGSYALAPGTIDLPALWRRLGIGLRGDAVVYDDAAPLAGVRRAITARR